MPIIKKQSGFALVEVLVTAVILAIGISGLGMLLLRAIQGSQDSAQQSQAMWMVHDYAGRIRSNAPGGRLREYVIEDTAFDCVNDKPVEQCADYYVPGDPGALVTADICLPDEMAAFDRWITLCGVSTDKHTYSSPSDFVVNPVLTSECTNYHDSRSTDEDTGKLDCVQYQISLTWDTKAIKGSAEESARVRQNSYSVTVELN